MNERESAIDEIELLLPWYETGALSSEESAKVEAWLAEHSEARAQLAHIRAEIDAAIADNEAVPAPGGGAADRLMARVTADRDRRATRRAAMLVRRLGAWLAALSPEMRGGLAAAGIVLMIVQAAVIALMADREPMTYQTASDAVGVHEGPRVIVAFRDDATMAEIGSLLAESGARLVDGPKPGGLYALALAEGADARAVAATLGTADTVSFVAIGGSE